MDNEYLHKSDLWAGALVLGVIAIYALITVLAYWLSLPAYPFLTQQAEHVKDSALSTLRILATSVSSWG